MGVVYLHHFLPFIERNTLESSNVPVIITSCIYLACKVSENHRSMRDIYNVISLLQCPEISCEHLEEVNIFLSSIVFGFILYFKRFVRSKSSIVEAEHQLLRIMRFSVEVDLPHKYLLNLARYDCAACYCVMRG